MMQLGPSISGETPPLRSRRGLTILLLTVVVLTAGCSGAADEDSETEPLDSVPADVDVIAQVNFDAADETTGEALAEELNESAFGVDGDKNTTHGALWEEMLAGNESSSEQLDIQRATAFARLPENSEAAESADSYLGVIVEADASWEEIREQPHGNLDDAEQRTVDGVTVHVVEAEHEDAWVAELDDGTFAVGSEAAVRDVIETREGDADAVGGDLREAFEQADDGFMKTAVAVPDENMTRQQPEMEGNGGLAAGLDLPEIQVVTLVTDTEGSNVTVSVQATTENEEAASELAGLFEVASGVGSEMAEEEFGVVLDDIAVEQTDRHATIRVTMPVETIADLVEQFQAVGTGEDAVDSGHRSAEEQPAVAPAS